MKDYKYFATINILECKYLGGEGLLEYVLQVIRKVSEEVWHLKQKGQEAANHLYKEGSQGWAKEAAIAKALRGRRAWVLGFQEMKEDCRARKAEGRKVARSQPCGLGGVKLDNY